MPVNCPLPPSPPLPFASPPASPPPQVYWWHDKFRPRKPKYFNRVHTGYEWNKYNQTHYDHDNPPPKIVQVREEGGEGGGKGEGRTDERREGRREGGREGSDW